MGQKSSGCPICAARKDERAQTELDEEDSFWAHYEKDRQPGPSAALQQRECHDDHDDH